MRLEDGQDSAKVLGFQCPLYASPQIERIIGVNCVQYPLEFDESIYTSYGYGNNRDH